MSERQGVSAKDLAGKTALVTGSGRNNGRAIALELAAMGANLIVNSRSNREEADAVVREARALGADALAVIGDVSRGDTIDEIAARAVSEFGGVDITVSNAAIRPYQSFFDMSLEDWQRVLDTQLNTSFRLAKTFSPGMVERRWGRIIHITGRDALIGVPNRAHNVAAKGAIRGLTKALAIELGPYGITVNDVAPGKISHPDRELSHPVVTVDENSGRSEGDVLHEIPVGRLGRPEDVAYACGFLASTRADFFTGTLMCCFGGRNMVQ
jgi:3-oxoacyl-[acyl-carrier protein] reductase